MRRPPVAQPMRVAEIATVTSSGITIRIQRQLLSPNAYLGRHWREKNRERKRWQAHIVNAIASSCASSVVRELVSNEVLPGGQGHCDQVRRVAVTRFAPHVRRFIKDDDNLRFSVKPILDALKHVGLIQHARRSVPAVAGIRPARRRASSAAQAAPAATTQTEPSPARDYRATVRDRRSEDTDASHRRPKGGRAMNWFQQQRQDWIEEMLLVYGFIRRSHLMRKFGISKPQASTDLDEFNRMNPGAMRYDMTTKAYVRTERTHHTTVTTSEKSPTC